MRIKQNNQTYYVDRTGKNILEKFIMMFLNTAKQKIEYLTKSLDYPIAYDIENDTLLKVRKIKKLYQIKKDDKVLLLDASEMEDIKRL